MVWGHVYYDSKHSDSPGHVSTKQGHLWRKQLVAVSETVILLQTQGEKKETEDRAGYDETANPGGSPGAR